MADARGKAIVTIIVVILALAGVAVLPRIFLPIPSTSSTASTARTTGSPSAPAITIVTVTVGVLLIIGAGLALQHWLRNKGKSPDEDPV